MSRYCDPGTGCNLMELHPHGEDCTPSCLCRVPVVKDGIAFWNGNGWTVGADAKARQEAGEK